MPVNQLYYIALLCPERIDRMVLGHKLWLKEQFGCALALKSPAHLTLIPPFRLEENREEALIQALQTFTGAKEELSIVLNGFGHFSKRVVFIKVEENPALYELKKQTELHLIPSFGDAIKPGTRPFHPHVTLATRDLPLHAFDAAWTHFSTLPFRETFRAGTLSLLRLYPGQWKVIREKR